jgi:prepilin-type processing-associated H-X9-DG protein/prepilin-type N-terminal cleavage/methylation domain-containing protein
MLITVRNFFLLTKNRIVRSKLGFDLCFCADSGKIADMRGAAFTLIELLVVIAIIALLLAVLVPAMRAAREQSRAVVCALNLKHLSLALTAYDQENGTFPHGFDSSAVGTVIPPPEYPGYHLYDWVGRWWFQAIKVTEKEDFGKGTVVWCPAREVQDPGVKANILCGNYGVNRSICKDGRANIIGEFVGRPLGLYQIRRPGETLLVTDSGYSLISWRAAADDNIQRFENAAREGAFYVPGLGINERGTLFPGHEDDAIYGRHPKRTVNVAFADGHANKVKADQLLVEKTGGVYTNTFPLWLPTPRKK